MSARFSVLLMPLLLSACATPVGEYFADRWHDLADCVRLRGSLGVGLYVEADATSAIEPSIGTLDMTIVPHASIGWDPRVGRRPGQTRTAAFPFLLIGWPYYGYHEANTGYGDTHPYTRGLIAPFVLMGQHHVQGSHRGLFYLQHFIANPRIEEAAAERETPSRPIADHFWFAISGTVLVPSFDIGFNPAQFVDWLGGWFGLDLLDDDSRNRTEPKVDSEAAQDPS